MNVPVNCSTHVRTYVRTWEIKENCSADKKWRSRGATRVHGQHECAPVCAVLGGEAARDSIDRETVLLAMRD